MLMFYKERLIFLSVPKTGTTAYENALRDRADMTISNPPELKHAPVYRYNNWFRKMFLQVCDAEMELMAVMREPVSWLNSWWRYRQRPEMAGQPNATHDISFDDFVRGYLQGQRPAFAEVGSQATFLAPQKNGTRVTYLFRYEEPERLNRFLEERLNTKLNLTRENESPRMQWSLSPGVEKRLRQKCADEFALYDSID